MTVWETVAKKYQEVTGAYIDWDERFFECGECALEPIYEEDYNSYEDFYDDEGNIICPVCGEILVEAEDL